MMLIFEVNDRTGRIIRLTIESWRHIAQEHPAVQNIEEIKDALINPTAIKPSKYNPQNVRYYYRFNKEKGKYLFVAVRYLNGDGFIVTAYYMRNIQ